MPPRGHKRPRVDASPEDRTNCEESASHLVSFLTGYDNRGDDRDEFSDEDGQAGSDAADDPYDEDLEDDDLDEENATPIKKSKHGLVGTPNERPGSSRTTPRSTPRKRATPRKKEIAPLPQEGEEGFVRLSKADIYFSNHSRSAKTSGNSYSALVKPLTQAEYERYTGGARAKGKGRALVEGLMDDLALRFEQWELEIETGFNLLVYGFGSKRRLLNRFVTERLSKRGHCVVVNGHFPGLSIRDVISQIEDTLDIPQDTPVPNSAATPLERSTHRLYAYLLPPEALSAAKRKSTKLSLKPLFLVIHNVDAMTLRTPRSLGVLGLLAACPRIHIVASFDHLHTPLLFSATSTDTPPHSYAPGSWTGIPHASRGFNWIYHNLTTYDDYDFELSYQRLTASSTLSGLSGSATGGISEEGALQIMRSVPPMALRLLKLLITKQLSSLPPHAAGHTAHPANPISPVFGIDNDILQKLSREKFIAREEERYNALMGEFKDHGLVVEAMSDAEGRQGRWVWIPLGKAALERVLQEMSSVEV